MKKFYSSPKNAMFALGTADLAKQYANALLSDDNRTADDARELGLKLGFSLDVIDADIRKAAMVKRQLSAFQAQIDDAAELGKEKAELARRHKKLSDELAALQKEVNVAHNGLLRIQRLTVKANEAGTRIDSLKRDNPRLFGVVADTKAYEGM